MRRLTILLSALLVVTASCTSEPVEAFAHGEDDLCEWVTEEDVAEFARDAYAAVDVGWDGEAMLLPENDEDEYGEFPPECQWLLYGPGGGEIVAQFLPVEATDEIVDYADFSDFSSLTGPTAGHPDLPEGVLVAGAAFGRFSFWQPGMDDALMLSVILDQTDDGIDQQAALFVVAKGFLEEMGWAD